MHTRGSRDVATHVTGRAWRHHRARPPGPRRSLRVGAAALGFFPGRPLAPRPAHGPELRWVARGRWPRPFPPAPPTVVPSGRGGVYWRAAPRPPPAGCRVGQHRSSPAGKAAPPQFDAAQGFRGAAAPPGGWREPWARSPLGGGRRSRTPGGRPSRVGVALVWQAEPGRNPPRRSSP